MRQRAAAVKVGPRVPWVLSIGAIAPLLALQSVVGTVLEGADPVAGVLGVSMGFGLLGVCSGLWIPQISWRSGLLAVAVPAAFGLFFVAIGSLSAQWDLVASVSVAVVGAGFGACSCAWYAARVRDREGPWLPLACLVVAFAVMLAWPGWGCHGGSRLDYGHCHPAFEALHLH